MLGKILRRTAVHFYDDIGRCLLLNLLWFGITAVGILLTLPAHACFRLDEDSPLLAHFVKVFALPLFSLLVTGPPVTAGFFYYANHLVRYEYPDTRTFFRGMKRFAFRAWGLGLSAAIIIILLGAGILIYAHYMRPAIGVAAFFLAAISVWILLYFLGVQLYAWTFLVHQDTTVWLALKRGTLLFLMRPFLSLALLFVCLVLFSLNWTRFLPLVPLLLFEMALLAILGNVAVLVCLEEYPE